MSKNTWFAIGRLALFVVGLYLAYTVGRINNDFIKGFSEGTAQGQVKACNQALNGFANIYAKFGYSRNPNIIQSCRMDGDDVVMEMLHADGSVTRYNLDTTDKK